MSRCQRIALLLAPLALSLPAAILPEGIEFHTRKNVVPLQPAPAAVWQEYGLQEAEKASYIGKTGSFTASAWRLPDSTSALAAWQMLRPANAVPSDAVDLAAKSGDSLLLVLGNYVLQFDGFVPAEETLNQLRLHMPRYNDSSLPALTGFLPQDSRIPNSERFILGPASLEAYVPSLSPSQVAFHFGTEGQLARFRDADGEVEMVLLNYPNPQIARERYAAFAQVKSIVAKRSGPLVAIVTKTATADAAERVLARVRWQANLSVNERPSSPKGDDIGVLIVNIAKFSGLMVVFCVFAGAAFAGFRLLNRKISGRRAGEPEATIGLHIDQSPGK